MCYLSSILTFIGHLNDERPVMGSAEFIRTVNSRFGFTLLDGKFARRGQLSRLAKNFTVIFHLQLVEDELVFTTTQVLDFNSDKNTKPLSTFINIKTAFKDWILFQDLPFIRYNRLSIERPNGFSGLILQFNF